jgi:osmotically-inducible protein OsmY
VAQGVVQLWGSVDSDGQLDALVLAAKRLPGVSSVQAHVTRLRPG